ncbi:hypothetical protein WJX82_011257 [Trebouxia sp. C0006]
MIGGPESLQYVEYDCMAVKLNDSDIILRKVLLLTSEVTDTVYLWCGQVMSSFEELTTAICAKLEAKVGELHDPRWTGRQKEQPQRVQALIRFQLQEYAGVMAEVRAGGHWSVFCALARRDISQDEWQQEYSRVMDLYRSNEGIQRADV